MNFGFSEMLFIFVAALIIFGPKRLPEIGRQIGKAMAEFKRHSNDFKSQLESEIRQIELEEAVKKLERDRPPLPVPENTVPQSAETVSTAPEPPSKGPDA